MALRRVATKAEQGNLAYIHELIARSDGKAVQVVDRQDVPIHELSDAELLSHCGGRRTGRRAPDASHPAYEGQVTRSGIERCFKTIE